MAGAASAAMAVALFLPTWKPGLDPFLPGWAVFISSFVYIQLMPAGIATLIVAIHLGEEFFGRPRRSTALGAGLGALLAAGAGIYAAAISDIGVRRLGPGYWVWASSMLAGLAAGCLPRSSHTMGAGGLR